MAEQLFVIRIVTLLPALALVASCAGTATLRDDSAELAQETAGKIAEKPRSCIALNEAQSTKVYSDALVYRSSRRLVFVNNSKGCRSFDPDPIFVNEVRGSQLCRGDVVRMISRGSNIPGPFCILGDFTPYRTPR